MYIFNKFCYTIKTSLVFTALIFPFVAYSKESQLPIININGMVKLDLIYDFNSPNGDRINYKSITSEDSIEQGQVRLHARESRLKISTSQGVLGKQYKTVLEGDFYAGGSNSPTDSEKISNSASFRLRHAYMSYGDWLIGQTWSNYVDVESFPETLDFSNDTGQAFIRQGQIRYSHKKNNLSISYSIENPETDLYIPDTSTDTNDPIFDAVVRARYGSFWGHFSLQTVVRTHKVYTNSNQITETGYGLGTSGKVHVTPNSLIKFHYSQGLGIGRYIQEASGAAGLLSTDSNNGVPSLMLLNAKGGYLGYQYTFRKTFRINISSGFMDIDYPDVDTYSNRTQKFTSYHTNIIWSAMPNMDVGIEHSNVILHTVAGESRSVRRLQLSTKIRF